MKRSRKGRTRTGAIPTCMAAAVAQPRPRLAEAVFGRGYAEVVHGPWAGYSHDFGNALDGVQLFAQSHPQQGACTCMVAAPFMRPTTSVDDCARHGEA
jgi:hypothetical protein